MCRCCSSVRWTGTACSGGTGRSALASPRPRRKTASRRGNRRPPRTEHNGCAGMRASRSPRSRRARRTGRTAGSSHHRCSPTSDSRRPSCSRRTPRCSGCRDRHCPHRRTAGCSCKPGGRSGSRASSSGSFRRNRHSRCTERSSRARKSVTTQGSWCRSDTQRIRATGHTAHRRRKCRRACWSRARRSERRPLGHPVRRPAPLPAASTGSQGCGRCYRTRPGGRRRRMCPRSVPPWTYGVAFQEPSFVSVAAADKRDHRERYPSGTIAGGGARSGRSVGRSDPFWPRARRDDSDTGGAMVAAVRRVAARRRRDGH